ncbi:transferase [Flavobacterium sp. KBS0721]|uniref:transferase n=1 Tax=Flavobacterium sp. KBS0721 TaxID=1179672 RepID=UPI00098FDA43|nr:transferase [Flavobacterium sp. KBS0721]
MLLCDFSDEYVLNLLFNQLKIFKLTENEEDIIRFSLENVKKRLEHCFINTSNKYYSKNNQAYFNPFHSGQWCIFLYFLSNSIFQKNNENRLVCDKVYYLNRMLNSCDLFYEVNLPDIFHLDHPLGSVIGRGTFGDNFLFTQGCTVGNNKGIFPTFGKNVKMLSNTKVLGNSKIGNNVIISANTYIKDTNIPDNCMVFGSSPNLVIKPIVSHEN